MSKENNLFIHFRFKPYGIVSWYLFFRFSFHILALRCVVNVFCVLFTIDTCNITSFINFVNIFLVLLLFFFFLRDFLFMIGQRIESIRKMLGFSQAQLASSLGISQQAYGNYERNESEPKIAMLIKIAELGSCTLEWLMTGVNSTFIPPRANANNLVPTVSPSKGNWYPIIGKVRAGTEIIYTDEDVIGEIFIDYYKTALCFCVTVEGDSMLPRLSAGDVVLVDPSDTPVSGDIVVVVLSGRQMIKKYVVTREGIEFHSYNENYPVIYPSGDEDVQGIFRVVMIQPKPIHL